MPSSDASALLFQPTAREAAALDAAAAARAAAAASGAVLLIGEQESGRARLILLAAREAHRATRRFSILDADPEGGVVAPPGAIGLARLDVDAEKLQSAALTALGFIGDLSPPGHLLPIVGETLRLFRHGREAGDELVLVRAPAFTKGRLARKFMVSFATTLHPGLVIICGEAAANATLAKQLAAALSCRVILCSVAQGRPAPASLRRLQRDACMHRYLEGSRSVQLTAAQVQTAETWLFTGQALPAGGRRQAGEVLRCDVVYGERVDEGTWLCTNRRPDRKALQELGTLWQSRIWITRTGDFSGLLCGLYERGGWMAGLGLLELVDFAHGHIIISTPVRSTGRVSLIQFGRLRLRSDGSLIARLRPADL